jgi:hypothetical protein
VVSTEAARSVQKRRQRWRLGAVTVAIAVFAVGNALDLLRLHSWGPAANSKQWIWIQASAALFWLALAWFAVSLADLVSILRHGSRPPTVEDLDQDEDPQDRILNPIRRRASMYHPALGLAGLVVGGLFGHFFWKP